MRANAVILSATTLIAFVLAGCMSGGDEAGAPDANDDAAHDHGAMADGYAVRMTNCLEGGGVSTYNSKPGTPDPSGNFEYANIYYDVGEPRIASYGNPVQGPFLHGIWHITVVCDAYDHDGKAMAGPLSWGWVGVKVMPPAWDDSGIQDQWFITDLSFNDMSVVQALKGRTGTHASETWNAAIDWVQETALHSILDDEEHGVFETHAVMEPYKAYETEQMRFWMLVDLTGAGGEHGHDDQAMRPTCPDPCEVEPRFQPISIDFVNTDLEGAQHFTAKEDAAFLSHTRTAHHGSTPGAAGNLGAVVFDSFDRTMTIGPIPPLTVNTTWLH